MKWNSLLSAVRYGQESRDTEHKTSFRSEFQRDYDRLIFSSAFRRMQNKTQVFPLPGSVFVHNRLTHSLEVASVGRSLGNVVAEKIIRKETDTNADALAELGTIVSSACLAHNMGNPPFGHSGEKALSTFFVKNTALKSHYDLTDRQWNDLVRFEGNANALRLLTHQYNGWRYGGFSLTYSTLASLIKYPYSSAKSGKKYGYFSSEQETFHKITELLEIPSDAEGNAVRHPLVYLVEAADDISYLIMDLEDAHKLRIINHQETTRLLLSFQNQEQKAHTESVFREVTDNNERISYLRAIAVNTLVSACADVFMQHYDAIMEGTFQKSLVDYLPKTLKDSLDHLRTTGFDKIYKHRKVIEIELAGFNILGTLVEEFVNALDGDSKYHENILSLIPQQYNIKAEYPYDRLRAVVDYISGMTDVYALELYRNIKGIEMPSLR